MAMGGGSGCRPLAHVTRSICKVWPRRGSASLGEHGSPRIDTSEHVWFVNDQLAVRFIEEIDFDYAAPDATAVLLTAAS